MILDGKRACKVEPTILDVSVEPNFDKNKNKDLIIADNYVNTRNTFERRNILLLVRVK